MGTDDKKAETAINLSQEPQTETGKPATEQQSQTSPESGQMGDGPKDADNKQTSGQST